MVHSVHALVQKCCHSRLPSCLFLLRFASTWIFVFALFCNNSCVYELFCVPGTMHCDPKWEQPQDITLAGMFFIIGRALGDPSAIKAVNQLLQKTQHEQQQQMVSSAYCRCLLSFLTSIFQFHLAEAWAARLIQPLEAEHHQVRTHSRFVLETHRFKCHLFRLFLLWLLRLLSYRSREKISIFIWRDIVCSVRYMSSCE